jgi:hypothetical protein
MKQSRGVKSASQVHRGVGLEGLGGSRLADDEVDRQRSQRRHGNRNEDSVFHGANVGC